MDKIRYKFSVLVNRYELCILGCTEFPILYEKYVNAVQCQKVYDSLLLALQTLKKERDND